MAVIKLTKDNFDQEVMQSDKPVLIDFYADWCGPCKMMSPVVEEVSDEMPDVKVCKINIDEEMDLAQKYGVMSIPTFISFNGGEIRENRSEPCQKAHWLIFLNNTGKARQKDARTGKARPEMNCFSSAVHLRS